MTCSVTLERVSVSLQSAVWRDAASGHPLISGNRGSRSIDPGYSATEVTCRGGIKVRVCSGFLNREVRSRSDVFRAEVSRRRTRAETFRIPSHTWKESRLNAPCVPQQGSLLLLRSRTSGFGRFCFWPNFESTRRSLSLKAFCGDSSASRATGSTPRQCH